MQKEARGEMPTLRTQHIDALADYYPKKYLMWILSAFPFLFSVLFSGAKGDCTTQQAESTKERGGGEGLKKVVAFDFARITLGN